MKICIIPDIHGSHSWEEAKKVKADFYVAMGDYFDAWKNAWPDQGENFLNFISWVREDPEHRIPLYGNHDHCYLSLMSSNCSGHQYIHANEIKALLLSAKDVLRLAFECDGWVFSHAGFSKTSVREMKKLLGYNKESSFIDTLNKAFSSRLNLSTDKDWKEFDSHLDWYGLFSGSGDEVSQFCLWIRPHSLLKDAFYDKQIVGHTEFCFWMDPIVLQKDDKKVMLTDSLDHHIHIIDTNEEFKSISELDFKKKIKKLNKAICDLKSFFGVADISGTPINKKAVVLERFPQNGEFIWNNFFKEGNLI